MCVKSIYSVCIFDSLCFLFLPVCLYVYALYWYVYYQSSQFSTFPSISLKYVAQCLATQSIINLFQLAFVFSSVTLRNSQNATIFSCLFTSDLEASRVVCVCVLLRGFPFYKFSFWMRFQPLGFSSLTTKHDCITLFLSACRLVKAAYLTPKCYWKVFIQGHFSLQFIQDFLATQEGMALGTCQGLTDRLTDWLTDWLSSLETRMHEWNSKASHTLELKVALASWPLWNKTKKRAVISSTLQKPSCFRSWRLSCWTDGVSVVVSVAFHNLLYK